MPDILSEKRPPQDWQYDWRIFHSTGSAGLGNESLPEKWPKPAWTQTPKLDPNIKAILTTEKMQRDLIKQFRMTLNYLTRCPKRLDPFGPTKTRLIREDHGLTIGDLPDTSPLATLEYPRCMVRPMHVRTKIGKYARVQPSVMALWCQDDTLLRTCTNPQFHPAKVVLDFAFEMPRILVDTGSIVDTRNGGVARLSEKSLTSRYEVSCDISEDQIMQARMINYRSSWQMDRSGENYDLDLTAQRGSEDFENEAC
ncbi:uncharacterized protein MYCFIDRAFT_84706 [Pseudocercospora fijiensis CIRAD86]|uniref:Uncharacterized protein n=1 Tax=Pseudocercospora fijiensis (strain CIRAD86) TaxID=383855 RepID=M3AHM9_PSEFD|nr:uncharacterized protein MYCFIDRAFT_84706 [Pseudocercospora fijiensis CIRAD86]EME77022.1 hypothetical protein MYCFIDRAFT_84706 [Pseudocercospora fijiensis CIRAD86]